MDQKTEPTGGLTAGYILTQLGSDVRGGLIDSTSNDPTIIIEKSVSGGYAGAIQYTLLYWLFGYFGAKFIMIVMFAISIMLMTGKSYVELARNIRNRGGRLLSLLRMKFFVKRPSPLAASGPGKDPNGRNGAVLPGDDFDDEEEEYEQPARPARTKRKPLFFSWFNDVQEQDGDSASAKDSEWLMEERQMSHDREARSLPHWHDDEEDEGVEWQSYRANGNSPALDPEIDDALPWDEQSGVESGHAGNLTDLPDWMSEAGPVSNSDEESDAVHSGGSHGNAISNSPSSASLILDENDIERLEPDAAITPRPPAPKPYQMPSLSLLAKPGISAKTGDISDANDSRRKLEATLESFGVRAKVLDVVRGPAVTRYEVQPATGVKVSRIVGLTDDIALALAAKDIRMEAPIPGKSAIGIEVPNMEVSVVTMREVMETPSFLNAPSKLSIAFGRDISGQPIVGNLAKMPHLLVAGATGSGKSVCINGIITSILYKAKPDEVKFLMVDPKMVELNVYNGIPHLLAPVVTDPRRASLALKKIVVEMEKRYEMFSKSGTRNIEGYNTLMAANPAAVLPYIVVIVDELADLMMVAANDVEDAICRLAQMARAAGIHLIIATQRPSVDVITGVIKANIPSRIAFGVSSQVDSRTILDMVGAEKLLGRGDMLFLPVGMSKPIRVQGAFLSDQEVEAVVTFSRGQAEAEYKEDLVPELDDSAPEGDEMLDDLYDQAVRIVIEAKQASVSLLQRRMRIGYTRAARLIDQMEARNVVGPYEGSKPREVMMTLDQYDAGKISS
ncbi:DNA translocase FtsK [Paenibacillus sp. sptzw28]|nr:DNA translocase FtsK [Paenibacillus sp. sptzw28]